METASFNGRRAANAVLVKAGSRESPAATIAPYRPPEWEAAKSVDEGRYRSGQPNVFDTEMGETELNRLLNADPELLDRLR
jgi:hypothetical protein